jgi:hypothetical protein
MTRVAVTGGRYYADVPHIWRTLDALHAQRRITCLIDGASDDVTGPYIGADYWSHQWAEARQIPTIRMHADWRRQGRAAGPIRNQRMVDECEIDVLVRFLGSSGTANMAFKAWQAKIEIIDASTRAEENAG